MTARKVLPRLDAMALSWAAEHSVSAQLDWQGKTIPDPPPDEGDLALLTDERSPVADLLPALKAAAFLHGFLYLLGNPGADELERIIERPWEPGPDDLFLSPDTADAARHTDMARSNVAFLARMADSTLRDAGWRYDPADRKVKAIGSKRELLTEAIESVYEEVRVHYVRMSGDGADNPRPLREVLALNLAWFFPQDQLDPEEGGTIQTVIRNLIARQRREGFRYSPATGYIERI